MSAPYGNADRRPADPSFDFPSRKGGLTQEQAVHLSISFVLNLVLPATILLLLGLLILLFNRNPRVLTQEEGQLYYRTTEKFKLTPQVIHTFLRYTTESLLMVKEKPNDLTPLRSLVFPGILSQYNQITRNQREEKPYLKRFFNVEAVRRYNDPAHPQLIGAAIRGQRMTEETIRGRITRVRKTSEPAFFIANIQQVPVSPNNPWGLILAQLREETEPEKIEKIWNASTEWVGTEDLLGNRIVPDRKEFLPPPLFELSAPYDWTQDFPENPPSAAPAPVPAKPAAPVEAGS